MFVQFGRKAPSWPLAERVLGPDTPAREGYGHDGKEFWVLARDPALAGGPGLARLLDRPAYRAQRILYPALAAPWRLGGERALLWGLLITNLLAVGAGGWAAGLLSLRAGAPAWGALAFAANPAVIVTVQHDGCDAVALAALLGSLLLLGRGVGARAGLAAAAAALAKEASLLSIGGGAALARGIPLRSRVAYALPAAAAAAAWGLYARWRLGWPGTGLRELTPPLAGYADAWRGGAWASVLLLPAAALTLVLWWRRRTLLLAAAVPYALLVPFLSAHVLGYGTGALRAFGPAITLVALELLRLTRRPR